MAERRMLTKKVTDDDDFMALSSSAQALYLHLTMSADDDGFCNQTSLSMFRAHASVQDLQALIDNSYIYQFDNGVVAIKHWRMANALRKDRYTPTAYQKELAELVLEESGIYARLPDGCQVVAERLPDGCQMVASRLPDGCQVVAGWLPQDSIGKDSIDNNIYTAREEDEPAPALGVYGNVQLTKGELKELIRQYPDDYQDMIENLSSYMRSHGKMYSDHFATLMRWKHNELNKGKAPPGKGGFWDEFDRLKENIGDD